MSLKDEQFKNLCDFDETFKSLGIPYMVGSGLLLGLYRDKDVIEGDEDDTDLYVFKEYAYRSPEFIKALEEKGFYIIKDWHYINGTSEGIAIKKNNNKIDIIMVNTKQDKVRFYLADNRKGRWGSLPYYAFVYPKIAIEPGGEIGWRERKFPCPKNIELYLLARYGNNWRVPFKRSEGYRLEIKECNPCVRGDWNYEDPNHLL